ncbi:PAS domain S-box protein (plasmid) [Cupriavidus sp. KK10]|uniref:ATP-binding protein n=1 Tax=Cupriavidus sp. KK10 TaxID=1478019 RepID=UPI001BA4568B|nr:ATP-binding protein [Cupriavidus sp. KK10]QUN32601.1 PAS domain S-box protein [Cupriavidus sp. KK10]
MKPRARRYWAFTAGGFLVVALVWTTAIGDLQRTRQLTLAANDRELASLSSALAGQTARLLQGAEQILRSIAASEAVHSGRLDPADAARFLAPQTVGVPQVRALSIGDASGKLFATSRPTDVGQPSIGSRSDFQRLKQAQGGALDVSEPFTSAIDGKRAFDIGVRLQDKDGQFQGVALAEIDEAYMTSFYRDIDIVPGTTIVLRRADGRSVMTYSNPGELKLSGDVRSAARAVPNMPLTLVVSRNDAAVLNPWHATAASVLARTGFISAFIMLLMFALIARMRRLERVNDELESSERRWRTVYENAPVGIMVLRAHGRYLMANPAFQRMVGYTDAELAERRALDITHPDDHALTQAHIDELVRDGRDSVRFQKRYLHRDGHVVWTDMSVARVFADRPATRQDGRQGEVLIIATVEDITHRLADERERRRLEGQLRQSQKLEALGTFAGGVAHDFNNILGAILGFGERALAFSSENPTARKHIEQVMKAGDRARLLVERILTFSRSGTTARVPVDLHAVATEAVELLRATAPVKVLLDVKLDGEGTYVMGDATHMHQVIMNLCSNAVHAMPNGGMLGISLDRVSFQSPVSFSVGAVGPGAFAQLRVTDQGVGISADVLERMFNPFFTTRRAGEGTGLGLSLVDGIVREYGGGIDVHTVQGSGSRFDVYLPLTEARPSPESADCEDVPRGNGQVVLLVDDEEALVALEEEVLADLGYEPVGFRSSVAAWQALEVEPDRFDAIITDQTMPDLTGLALAARVAELRPDLPVILCSGFSNPALERDARGAGVRFVLRKPLRQAELAKALAAVFQTMSQR